MLTRAKSSTGIISHEQPMWVEQLLTKNDVAKALGVHASQVMRLVKRGEFPQPIRVGTLPRWRPRDVKAWLDEQNVKNSEACNA